METFKVHTSSYKLAKLGNFLSYFDCPFPPRISDGATLLGAILELMKRGATVELPETFKTSKDWWDRAAYCLTTGKELPNDTSKLVRCAYLMTCPEVEEAKHNSYEVIRALYYTANNWTDPDWLLDDSAKIRRQGAVLSPSVDFTQESVTTAYIALLNDILQTTHAKRLTSKNDFNILRTLQKLEKAILSRLLLENDKIIHPRFKKVIKDILDEVPVEKIFGG